MFVVVGCCCLLLVVVGCCWLLLVVVGRCWSLLVVVVCCLLLFVVVCCCLLLFVVVCCCLLLLVVVGCCWLLFVVVCCCLLLLVVVCCCLLLLVVVGLLFVVVCCLLSDGSRWQLSWYYYSSLNAEDMICVAAKACKGNPCRKVKEGRMNCGSVRNLSKASYFDVCKPPGYDFARHSKILCDRPCRQFQCLIRSQSSSHPVRCFNRLFFRPFSNHPWLCRRVVLSHPLPSFHMSWCLCFLGLFGCPFCRRRALKFHYSFHTFVCLTGSVIVFEAHIGDFHCSFQWMAPWEGHVLRNRIGNYAWGLILFDHDLLSTIAYCQSWLWNNELAFILTGNYMICPCPYESWEFDGTSLLPIQVSMQTCKQEYTIVRESPSRFACRNCLEFSLQ